MVTRVSGGSTRTCREMGLTVAPQRLQSADDVLDALLDFADEAVAATRSPRSSAATAHSRPKPRELQVVMNHVFLMRRPFGRAAHGQGPP